MLHTHEARIQSLIPFSPQNTVRSHSRTEQEETPLSVAGCDMQANKIKPYFRVCKATKVSPFFLPPPALSRLEERGGPENKH